MSFSKCTAKHIFNISCKGALLAVSSIISWHYFTEIPFAKSESSLLAQSRRKLPTGRTRPIGADRDDCPRLPAGVPALTALTDESGFTATLSQSPTFRFYTPYAKGKYQFRLRESRKSKKLLYSQDITRNDQAGIFTVSLPKINAIKPRINYFWELEYFCNNKPNPDSLIVFDWVYQDQLTASQMAELREAKDSSDRIAFYRKYGIWLELLDEIAKLLPASQTLWRQTLDTEGLQSVSKQPVLSIQSSPTPIKP
ncbi:MAG: hypothetical protein AUK48_09735 [Oscillatoriales cyanobacterium CG2_30_44_21]|nr:MAG: hypothetical protein AUK48_09735 [Oscillatoriales cyanobacterium CG2_30_44_21]